MTINATAATLLAMYVVVGEEQGVPRAKLTGTVQNDILKEYIARGTYIYPAGAVPPARGRHLPLLSDEGMSFNPISISGYHMREAGATAVQEVAFTLANALEYVRVATEAGLALDAFGPRLSFFFASHNDLFEEVAKFRAARRLWARLVRERYRRERRHRATAIPYADRRGHAAGAAAAHQRRSRGVAGARGRAGWNAVAAHQRLRRGAGVADGRVCDARAPHPADHRLRERRRRTWSIRWPGATTSRV